MNTGKRERERGEERGGESEEREALTYSRCDRM